MFPRRARLSRVDFAALASDRSAKRASTAHFSAVCKEDGDVSGCAVVISKKVEKGSVRRHLLKRRILSAIKTVYLPAQALIVYAREGSGTLPFSELSVELQNLLARVSSKPTL
jgi:ribonuclease P protein component